MQSGSPSSRDDGIADRWAAVRTDKHRDTFPLCRFVITVFGVSIALADYTIRLFVSVLDVGQPHFIVAGYTEPITTKLIPAVMVITIVRKKGYADAPLRANPYLFGALGGLSFGLLERLGYLLLKDATLSPTFLVAPLMHVITGLIVAGTVFGKDDERNRLRNGVVLTTAVLVAMAIHLLWNGWGVVYTYHLLN